MSNFAYDFGCYYSQPSFQQPYSPRKRIRTGDGFGSDPGIGAPDMNFHSGQGQNTFVANTINIHNSYCTPESDTSAFPSSAEVHGWARRNLTSPQDNIRRGPTVHEGNDFPRDAVQFSNHIDKISGRSSVGVHNVPSFQDLSSACQTNSEGRNERNETIIRPTEIDFLDDSEDVITYSEFRERDQTYPEIDHSQEASNRELIVSYDTSLSRCHESVEIIRQVCGSNSSKFDFFCAKLQEALEALDRLGNPPPHPEIDLRLPGCHSDSSSYQAEFAAASFCSGNKFLLSLETTILPLVNVAIKLDDRVGSGGNQTKDCLAESLPRLLQLQKRIAELWASSDHALKLLSHYSCDGALKASENFTRYLHYRDRQEEKAKNPNRKWQQVKNDTALSLADNNLDCDELHDHILWQAYRNLASVNQPCIIELMPAVLDSSSIGDGKAAAIHYRDLLYEERALKLRLEALEKDISSKNRRLEHHQRCLNASFVLTSEASFEETVAYKRPPDTLRDQANISREIRLLKSAYTFGQKAPLSLLRELLESALKAVDQETCRQQERAKDESYLQSELLAISDKTSPSCKMPERMRKDHRIFLEKEIITIEQQRALCAETCRFLLYFAEHLSLQMFEGGTGFPSQAESDSAKAKCHLLHSKASSLLSQVSKSEPKKPSDDDAPTRSLVLFEASNPSAASLSLHQEAVVFRRCVECSRRIAACLDRSEHILPDGTVLSEVEVRAAEGFTELNPSILRMVVTGLAMLRQPNGPCHKSLFASQRAHAEIRPRNSLLYFRPDSSDVTRVQWEGGLQLGSVLSEAINWVLSGKYVSATVFCNAPGVKSLGEKRKNRNQDLMSGPSSLEVSTGAAFHIAASHMRVRYPWARRLAVADLRSTAGASAEGERSGYGLTLPLTGAAALDQQTLVVGVPDRPREHSSGSNLEEWARRFRSSVFEPIGAFGPDLIVVFFDAFSSVPCGGSSCAGSERPLLLGWICSALSELARSACRGRIIFVRAGGEGVSGPVRPTLHGLRHVIAAATGLTDSVPKLLLAPPGTNVSGPSWSEGLEGGESDDLVQSNGRPPMNGIHSPDAMDKPALEKKGKGRVGPRDSDGGALAEPGEAGGQRKPRIEGAPTLKPREAVLRVLSGRPEGMAVSELVEAVQLLPCNIDVKEGVNLRSSITHMLSVCSSGGPHSRSANHATPPTAAQERPRLFEKVWPGAPGSGTVRFRISKAWQSQD